MVNFVNFAKSFKRILPYPFIGGTKTGFKVLIRLPDLGCTTFADPVSFMGVLSDGKLSLAHAPSVVRGERLVKSTGKFYITNF